MMSKTSFFCTFVIYNISTYHLLFFLQNYKDFTIIKSPFFKNNYFVTLSCLILKNKYLNIFDNAESLDILFVIYDNTLFTNSCFLKYLKNKFLLLKTTNNLLYLIFYNYIWKSQFFKLFTILQRILLLK